MSDHYPADSNVGLGMVSDTPEEKEIERLSNRVKELERRLAQGREEGRREMKEECARVCAEKAKAYDSYAAIEDDDSEPECAEYSRSQAAVAANLEKHIRSLPDAPPTK